jgi:carbon-monoxide dehydrogenase medium subunit
MDCAVVGVAVLLELEPSSGVCQKARIALGAVAPTPIRAKRTEQLITGKKVNEISSDLVAETVCREVDPITDIRATTDYRSEMVSILTLRAIRSLTDNT